MYRLLVLTLVCCTLPLFAQRGSSTGNSSIGGRGGAAAGMGGRDSYQNTVIVQGRAAFEDGSPAPTDTLIDLRCIGQANMEEEVSPDGTFSFQFMASNTETMTGPASYGTNFGVAIDCKIQAMLNGHYSPQTTVGGKETSGMFNAGTLILYKKHGDVTGMTVSSTTLNAPKDAQKLFQRGQQAAAKKKWKDAIKQYEKAVEGYPEYAEAWYQLGRMHQIQKRAKEARSAYEKALAADDNFLPPEVNLALLDVQDGNWQQVAARTAEVLKANPYEFPEAYFYNVLANYQMDQLGPAEIMAKQALERNVDKTYPQIRHTLGMVLAALGRLEESVAEYEKFFALAPNHPDRKAAEEQLAIIKQNM